MKEDASEVFLSHRGGVLVVRSFSFQSFLSEKTFSDPFPFLSFQVPRFWGGKTLDYYFSRRASNILDALDSLRPCTSRWFMNGLGYLM